LGDVAIKTFGLTKRFRKEKIPAGVLGRSHWLLSLTLKLKLRKAEEFTAVDHVNLEVRRGELFGLLGPNGAGKTTLIKCLSTLLIPDEGTAIINGYDLLEEPEKVKRSINFLGSGQWVGFDWALTVRENLEFFANLYGLSPKTAKERIAEALNIVGLKDRADEKPHRLSAGMRQKMLLAKGFLIRTPIFFMDEPTIGLDPVSAREIRRYIKEKLRDEMGETILLTTHYMQEAQQLCDRVAIMDRGKIVACGTPEDLIRGLKRKEILEVEAVNIGPELLDEVRRIDSVENVGSRIEDEVMASGVIRVHTYDVESALPNVLQAIDRRGGKVLHVSISEPNLEDVFIELTGRGLGE